MSAVPNPIVIPMRVATNIVNVGMRVGFVVVGGMSEHYDGSYEFTPTESTQTIGIKDMVADDDIIINPIPSNYGRISYNGSVITVY